MISNRDDLARLIFESTSVTPDSDDIEAISSRLAGLRRGLPAEDEFSAIVAWLGRCHLVHKLGQSQYPRTSGRAIRVPDLLAIFEYRGKRVPVLIEVKVKKDRTLSWTPEYVRSLANYATAVRLPLLIAWKHASFWVLFEARHLKKATKNLNIAFTDALRNTLMSKLAGDFSFSFRPGSGLQFRIRKEQQTKTGWQGVIEEARFIRPDGRLVKSAPGVLPLFTCLNQESVVEENSTHLIQRFVIEDPKQAQFAHRALAIILATFNRDHRSPNWRGIIEQEGVPAGVSNLRDKAKHALKSGFLQHVLNIEPSIMPDFLVRDGEAG